MPFHQVPGIRTLYTFLSSLSIGILQRARARERERESERAREIYRERERETERQSSQNLTDLKDSDSVRDTFFNTNTSYVVSYRGTSLIKNCPLIGPYSRTMRRALRRS